jgi:hypothetical protein
MRNFLTAVLLLVSLPAVAAPTITISPNPVAPGGQITVSVRGAGGSASDWLWLNGATPSWEYLTGSQTWPGSTPPIASADLKFTVSTTPGSYTATLYANNATTMTLATATYTVSPSAPPSPPPSSGSGVSSLDCKGVATCAPTTGDVVLTVPAQPGPAGPAGAVGAAGPAGTAGSKGDPGSPGLPAMAQGTPAKGSSCSKGDSLYDFDSQTAPTKRTIWVCSSAGKWLADTPVSVAPW